MCLTTADHLPGPIQIEGAHTDLLYVERGWGFSMIVPGAGPLVKDKAIRDFEVQPPHLDTPRAPHSATF